MLLKSFSPENNKSTRRLMPVILGGCILALTACGAAETTDSSKPPVAVVEGDPSYEIYTEYKYHDNGTRTAVIYQQYSNLGIRSASEINIIAAMCDGHDLVESTRDGGAYERSVGHPACQDGRLTPEDTKPLPQ